MNFTLPMTLCTLAVTASLATAAGAPSIERGKELFGSTNLGTDGKSCSTCHSQGKGLVDAAGYDEVRLENIINQCIKKALKGAGFARDSAELKSLVMYVQTLANAAKKE